MWARVSPSCSAGITRRCSGSSAGPGHHRDRPGHSRDQGPRRPRGHGAQGRLRRRRQPRGGLRGADRLLLISASIPVGERVANHRRATDAALAAGVSLVAYTSMSHADTATKRRGPGPTTPRPPRPCWPHKATSARSTSWAATRRSPWPSWPRRFRPPPGSRSPTPTCRPASSPGCWTRPACPLKWRTPKLVSSYTVPGTGEPTLVSDEAVTPTGDVYITDSFRAVVYWIPAAEVNSQLDTYLYGTPLTSPVFTLESLPLEVSRPRAAGSETGR